MLAGISWREATKLEDPVKTSSSNWDSGFLLSQGWDAAAQVVLCFTCTSPLPPICLLISLYREKVSG